MVRSGAGCGSSALDVSEDGGVCFVAGISGDGPFLLADEERPNGKKEIGHKRGYRVLRRLSAWLKTKGITHDRPVYFLRKVTMGSIKGRHRSS